MENEAQPSKFARTIPIIFNSQFSIPRRGNPTTGELKMVHGEWTIEKERVEQSGKKGPLITRI
jgi:hypothetical protein